MEHIKAQLAIAALVVGLIGATIFHMAFDIHMLVGVRSSSQLLAAPGQPTLEYRVSSCVYQGLDGEIHEQEKTGARCVPLRINRREPVQ